MDAGDLFVVQCGCALLRPRWPWRDEMRRQTSLRTSLRTAVIGGGYRTDTSRFVCALSALATISVCLLGGIPVAASALTANNPTITRINAFWQTGNRSAAHAAIDSLLPLARLDADSALTCRLLVMRGQMFVAMGDGARGEPVLREGLSLARSISAVPQELTALRWLGVALGQNLKDNEAQQVFRQMLSIAVDYGDRPAEAWAEVGLAYQNRRNGDLVAARQGYERSVDLFRKADQVQGEIFALNGLGNVLVWQQDFAAARSCYERTLTVSRATENSFVEALAENNLGTLDYNLGDPGLALAHFRRSYEINLREDNLREAVNTARNIAICLTNLGDHDRSLSLLNEALGICRERGYRELEYAALSQIARVLTIQKRPVRAVPVFEELLAWPDPMPAERTVELYVGYGSALADLGLVDRGMAFFADHEAEAMECGYPILRLQYQTRFGTMLTLAGQPREALRHLLAADAEAALVSLNSVRLAALPAAGRAYLVLDEPDSAMNCYRQASEVWEHERSVPLDPEWRERRGIAGQAIYTELAGLMISQENGVQRAYELLQRFKARTLLERMVGPEGGRLTDLKPSTLAELQDALRPQSEVFLDFFVGSTRSFLFTVTHESIRATELPAAGILAERVDLFRDLVVMENTGFNAFDTDRQKLIAAGALALRQTLFGPGTDELQNELQNESRIVYCPDGVLNKLPLSLVLAATGCTVQRAPSASIFTRLRGGEQTSMSTLYRMLVVADDSQARGTHLAAAAQEAAWLERHFHGVVRTIPDSVTLAAGFSGFDLIHLASHTRVSDDYPWRSTVRVRTTGGAEKLISATEIARSRQSARLTVLANCESAGGKIVTGEGVMGLSSAFIAAGSPTVVASLWPVDDAATYVLMRDFYSQIARGETVLRALDHGRSTLAGTAQFADPYFWAGFVLIGDGRQTFKTRLRHRPEKWQLYLIGGGVSLFAAAFLGRRQTKRRFL